MADAFETRLAGMFDEAPEFSDTSDFLVGLESRIDQARADRRMAGLIVAGAAALAVAATVAASDISVGIADLLLTAGDRVGDLLPMVGSAEQQTMMGWVLLGLGVLAASFGLKQVMEEA